MPWRSNRASARARAHVRRPGESTSAWQRRGRSVASANATFPRKLSPAARPVTDTSLPLDALETPAAIVDLARMERNLDRAAEYAAAHQLALRPHVKTHKSPRIAAAQIARGAPGLTCATPREAEVMAEVSDDLLIAYPPVGALRARRLASLPSNARVTVALDSARAAADLAAAAGEARRVIGV